MGIVIHLVVLVLSGNTVLTNTIPQVPANARELYENFKRQYSKDYANEDDEHRFSVFKSNLVRALQHQQLDRGTAKYGVTRFSDLTREEFRQRVVNPGPQDEWQVDEVVHSSGSLDFPTSFDWREKGAINPVEDQGGCMSSWIFSAIGNIEAQWFLKKGELRVFSKQQLLECDVYDHGCSGGLPSRAYKAVEMMGGLQLAEDYPYDRSSTGCHFDHEKIYAYVNASARCGPSEVEIAEKLSTLGPMSMTMNSEYLQFYQHGISHPPSDLCSADDRDSAVLAVGYGQEDGLPFWIVKNSLSSAWGEDGYFRIYRGDGSCGINRDVTYAIIDE